jgi:three-Cys-motif partner protein
LKKPHIENTVGPWARQKLDGLEAYLHGYTLALSKQPFELVYIDAFAGAGRSKIRTAWDGADDADLLLQDDEFDRSEVQFVEGSPRRALGIKHPFNRYYFFDMDAGRATLLQDLRREYPGRRIEVVAGDANALIQDLIPRVARQNIKGVAFLDPYGPHLDWGTVAVLGQTKKFEVIINFPLGMAINRLITRAGDIPDGWRAGLNGCFGDTTWESLVYDERTDLFGATIRHKVDDAAKRLLDHYVGRLRTLFGYVATPRVVRNTRGAPIYYMLWAGPHPLGQKIANHILEKGDQITPLRKRPTRR